jgi:hypothetical protein
MMSEVNRRSSPAQQQDNDDDDEDQSERASADPNVIRKDGCDMHNGSCAQTALTMGFAARFRSDGT